MTTQKRPRFSVGVLAVCCGVLSLSVVARESAAHRDTGGGSRKYAEVHHRPGTDPAFGSSGPVGALETVPVPVTTPFAPALTVVVDELHQRKTRDTSPFPRPATTSEESSTTATNGRVRRRRMEPKVQNLPSPLVFMPSRGRRGFGGFEIPAEKRQITIEQMLEKGDYFVPNRGKKTPTASELIKKGKFDVLLGGSSPDEYFFPNRGKKQYFVTYESGANGSPLVGRSRPGFGEKLAAFGVPANVQPPQPPMENRWRRNLLENLANEHKDTFFSSRGKRVLPFVEELMLLPAKALPAELRPDRGTPEVLPDDKSQELSAAPNDLDGLLWNEDVLLPLDHSAS